MELTHWFSFLVIEAQCVFCAVQTESNVIVVSFVLQMVKSVYVMKILYAVLEMDLISSSLPTIILFLYSLLKPYYVFECGFSLLTSATDR